MTRATPCDHGYGNARCPECLTLAGEDYPPPTREEDNEAEQWRRDNDIMDGLDPD